MFVALAKRFLLASRKQVRLPAKLGTGVRAQGRQAAELFKCLVCEMRGSHGRLARKLQAGEAAALSSGSATLGALLLPGHLAAPMIEDGRHQVVENHGGRSTKCSGASIGEKWGAA